ncbi:MAG: Rhomboid family protein [Planctomycetes bacterium ADurb.Bin401]|nr:MAG: Rhomboid family protein [Planctomycetes bacterium ADurb.Bin401]
MGIYDREYYRPDEQSAGGPPHMHMRFPQVTPIVKKLLILNIGIYVLCILIKPLGNFIYGWFSVDTFSFIKSMQIWRLIGYQFLHDPSSPWHLIMNMIGLYFLGPTLERFWQSKRFITFYLLCGAAGGVFYIFLTFVGVTQPGFLIGASGAILGMLAACAILFPHFVVFIFFFPVPIRLASVILIFLYVVNIFTGGANAGGDAAHLAGMAAGAGYVFLWPRIKLGFKSRAQTHSWEKKLKNYGELQKEVDRILIKVKEEGMASLTRKERKTLEEATKLEQMKSRF